MVIRNQILPESVVNIVFSRRILTAGYDPPQDRFVIPAVPGDGPRLVGILAELHMRGGDGVVGMEEEDGRAAAKLGYAYLVTLQKCRHGFERFRLLSKVRRHNLPIRDGGQNLVWWTPLRPPELGRIFVEEEGW
ncbi:hypothetical protein PspLS_09837 [Pyricularia sp. CBS 133598]|nr:hypothetical protein PspLS_09837 [Pyricularia sp. CBS 133598]